MNFPNITIFLNVPQYAPHVWWGKNEKLVRSNTFFCLRTINRVNIDVDRRFAHVNTPLIHKTSVFRPYLYKKHRSLCVNDNVFSFWYFLYERVYYIGSRVRIGVTLFSASTKILIKYLKNLCDKEWRLV